MLINKNDVLSETQFYIVENVDSVNVNLLNDDNQLITVSRGYADKFLSSASNFSSIEKVSRTEIIEIFTSNARVAMTVSFNKQIKETDIIKKLEEIYPNKGGKILSEKEYVAKIKAIIKPTLHGEERIITGRHYSHVDGFGRISFIDSYIKKDETKDYDTRMRLIDPRTINWIIVNDIKYIVK